MKAMKAMKAGAKALTKGALCDAIAASTELKKSECSKVLDSLAALARAARLSSTFEHSDFFSSVEAAIASQRAPLVRALAPAFIAFMAFIALGAISIENTGWARKLQRPESLDPKRLEPKMRILGEGLGA